MNYTGIEELKQLLIGMLKKGCNLSIGSGGPKGRIIGLGFNPMSATPIDTMIKTIRFEVLDEVGATKPVYLENILGYRIISYDGDTVGGSDRISMELFVLSPQKITSKEPYDKVQVDIEKTV
jgi:hypothetical protein